MNEQLYICPKSEICAYKFCVSGKPHEFTKDVCDVGCLTCPACVPCPVTEKSISFRMGLVSPCLDALGALGKLENEAALRQVFANSVQEHEMRERPILFSGEMVKAILEGRKTQTRRVAKDKTALLCLNNREFLPIELIRAYCPYGQVGDRLWVRETFALHPTAIELDHPIVFYKARGDTIMPDNKWRPSIFMPRWASRILLEITDIRVERIQKIGESDSAAEGWTRRPEVSEDPQVHKDAARDWYMDLWNSINGKKHPWASNPWCWVISFKRLLPAGCANAEENSTASVQHGTEGAQPPVGGNE